MTKKFATLLTLLVLHIPAVSLADSSPLYINVNAVVYDTDLDSSYKADGATLGLGWDLNNFLAFEVLGGISETYEDETTGNTSDTDYVASAFMRFNMRFAKVTMYLMGGYSKIKTTDTVGSTTYELEADGTSYGYGIDFYGTPDLALSLRRIEFIDIDKPGERANMGATMLGITYYYDTPKIRSRY